MSSRKCVAIVGSTTTPDTPEYPIGTLLRKVAHKMFHEFGWDITSGRAPGADTFAEEGVGDPETVRNYFLEGRLHLFLPQEGFKGRDFGTVITNPQELAQARQILLEKVYSAVGKPPRAISLSDSEAHQLVGAEPAIRRNFTRNVFQILRRNLDNPVDRVVCWTPDGCIGPDTYKPGKRKPDGTKEGTGGTGIAICLAHAYGIKVMNAEREDHRRILCDFVGMDYFDRPAPAKEPEHNTQVGFEF